MKMEAFLYWLVRSALALVRIMPLTLAARIGRLGGALAYLLDARHRRVATCNLALCFPEKNGAEIRALARENFRRIGENFTCAARTAFMGIDEIRRHVTFHAPALAARPHARAVVAIGHFGNFELYARFGQFTQRVGGTTYRGVRQPGLNRLLLRLRQRSGCHFFERRFDVPALKAFMNEPEPMLGLLADQHAGDNGLRLPFFGHDCSTSAAPAVFALRYHCRLFTGYCFRTGLGRWHLEAGPEILTQENGQPRSTEAIMRDVNHAFEAAIRRDPANWFWVHNRWKLKWKLEGNRRGSPRYIPRASDAGA